MEENAVYKSPILRWNEVECGVRSFRLGNEPEMIHIINSGFEDEYFVLQQDGFSVYNGRVDVLSSEEIKEKYKIIV